MPVHQYSDPSFPANPLQVSLFTFADGWSLVRILSPPNEL